MGGAVRQPPHDQVEGSIKCLGVSLLLDGILVHCRLTSQLNLVPEPIHTLGWREKRIPFRSVPYDTWKQLWFWCNLNS
jgi:hypothetical protein